MKLNELLRKRRNIQEVNISGCGRTWTGNVGSALTSPTVPNESYFSGADKPEESGRDVDEDDE